MRGKFKNADFFIGRRQAFSCPTGGVVIITEEENHPIFGKRYKVSGFSVWFEANCFEYIED